MFPYSPIKNNYHNGGLDSDVNDWADHLDGVWGHHANFPEPPAHQTVTLVVRWEAALDFLFHLVHRATWADLEMGCTERRVRIR